MIVFLCAVYIAIGAWFYIVCFEGSPLGAKTIASVLWPISFAVIIVQTIVEARR